MSSVDSVVELLSGFFDLFCFVHDLYPFLSFIRRIIVLEVRSFRAVALAEPLRCHLKYSNASCSSFSSTWPIGRYPPRFLARGRFKLIISDTSLIIDSFWCNSEIICHLFLEVSKVWLFLKTKYFFILRKISFYSIFLTL